MVTAITNPVTPAVSQIYRYDDVGRLIQEERNAARYNDYTYDPSGNRTSSYYSDGATTTNYTVSTTSNRLLNVGAATIAHDPNGNVTSDGTSTFVYDAFNRMSSATGSGGSAVYAVNGLGQRVYKEAGTTQTWFSYAPDGSLLGEYKRGQGWSAYIWADGEIIGMVRDGQLYSVHNDHLGRPEQITDSAKAVVWKADNYGFNRLVRQDAIGGYNIGFPGQYYDSETDTWNNGFRTYAHSTGRYLQSDPIGLAGGINTYAYVNGNPVNLVDPLGLEAGGGYSTGLYNMAQPSLNDCQAEAIVDLGINLTEVGAIAGFVMDAAGIDIDVANGIDISWGNYGEVDTPAAALGHAGDIAARRYDRRATGQAARAQQRGIHYSVANGRMNRSLASRAKAAAIRRGTGALGPIGALGQFAADYSKCGCGEK